ncbi:MAG: hypothetical protein RLN78_04195 [Phycisphaerales bacterium]
MAKKKTTKKTSKKAATNKSSSKAKNAKKKTPPDECFVIMPFGGWADIYYDSIFLPAIKKAGLVPRRADDIFKPTSIVNDIWQLTLNAKVLLADLTGKNPNVLYELGLAHACCKPVVIITESMDDVPFDLQSLRVIPYDKNEPKWGSNLSIAIREALAEIMQDPDASVPTPFLAQHPKFPATKESSQKQEIANLQSENSRLRRQTRQMGSRDYSIGSLERMIEQYLLEGLPSRIILERMRKRGFSRSHVQAVMNAMKHHLNQS